MAAASAKVSQLKVETSSARDQQIYVTVDGGVQLCGPPKGYTVIPDGIDVDEQTAVIGTCYEKIMDSYKDYVGSVREANYNRQKAERSGVGIVMEMGAAPPKPEPKSEDFEFVRIFLTKMGLRSEDILSLEGRMKFGSPYISKLSKFAEIKLLGDKYRIKLCNTRDSGWRENTREEIRGTTMMQVRYRWRERDAQENISMKIRSLEGPSTYPPTIADVLPSWEFELPINYDTGEISSGEGREYYPKCFDVDTVKKALHFVGLVQRGEDFSA